MRNVVVAAMVLGQLLGAPVGVAAPAAVEHALQARAAVPVEQADRWADGAEPSLGAHPPGLLASVLLGVREAAPDRRETTLWGWPLVGAPTVVRGFDPPPRRWLPGHRGIDLLGVEGEAVLAVDDGVVTFSGEVAGVGVVSVTHASGLRSTYQPVADRRPRGDRVRRGEALGRLEAGGSHCLLGSCLHLGAVRGRDTYVDPMPLLLGVDLALLPVEP